MAYSRVRFTAEFAAYTAKPVWFVLDFLADYWHLLMQALIVFIALKRWLNLILVLLILTFVIYCIRITKRINTLKS